MQQPFNVHDDNINTLFKILFQNSQDKNFKVFDNKSDDEILSNLANGNVCFNKTSDNIYLCINVDGQLKKVSFGNGGSASAYIVETYNNGSEWYRIWSDGWIEQGGKKKVNSASSGKALGSINFLVAFMDTDYFFSTQIDSRSSTSNAPIYVAGCEDKNENSITISSKYINSSNVDAAGSWTYYWYACGFKND